MAAHSNGQAIIFSSCGFYLFLYMKLYFTKRLFSADWMSTILPHMKWH